MANSTNDRNFYKAVGKTFNDFSENSALHGFHYLTPRCDRTLLERSIWWILQLLAVFCVVRLVLFSWDEFMANPTVTTLENSNYPIRYINFPGVSICNLNKISRKKAYEYANDLALKSNHSFKKMIDLVNHFGKMYDFGSVTSDEILGDYQSVLEMYDQHNTNEGFNPYATFKELAPPCTELISDCIWGGTKYNCEDLFIYETTMEGFCCIFNYLPPQKIALKISRIIKDNNNKTLKPVGEGIHSGLIVKVHPHVEDYFYPLIASVGANVHIFSSNDFPDTTSGSLQERLVSVGVEMFIRLYATSIYAAEEVKKYPIDKRNCKFKEEATTLFGTKYSYSDCNLECRLNSMLALCQCVPFFFIKALEHSILPQCTLLDIPCMNRYREKWRRLYPLDYKGDEMETDKQDSLNCKNCVPTCSNTLYNVRNDFAYLLSYNNSQLNYSIVNIFFESGNAQLYKQDVVYYWFEIVSNFGGTCSLMLGLSLISIAEFIYFFTVVLYRNYFPEKCLKMRSRLKLVNDKIIFHR